jgi:hypothetical protein
MPHDLAELLKHVADRPEGDLNVPALWARGRRERRRRIAGSVVVTLVLLAAGTAAGTSLNLGDDDEPGPVRPAVNGRNGATAATYAFHALLNTVGYSHDYDGVQQTGPSQWKVTFHSNVAGRNDKFAIVVGERDGILVVKSLTGAFDSEDRDQWLAFTEKAESISARGHEFFDLRLDRGTVSARTFWIGPIPSSYTEVCAPSFIDKEGDKVSLGSMFGLHAPREEAQRDGAEVRLEGGAADGVDPRIHCRAADSPTFVPVGEPRIEPVGSVRELGRTDDVDPDQLDPDRFVFVVVRLESGVESRGERYSFGESICSAKVFDEGGREIGSQESTLSMATFTPAAERDVDKTMDWRSLVEVGDSERADSATVHCRPATPELGFGPE